MTPLQSTVAEPSSRTLVVARPELGVVAVSGPDRLSWLQGILTSDVAGVAPGRGSWGLLLTKQGKIVTDVSVVASDDTLYLSTAKGLSEEVERYLSEYLIMEDAQLADVTSGVAFVMIHGPASEQLAQSIAGEGALAAGVVDYTGWGGAAVAVERSRLDHLVRALAARGAAATDLGTWHELRLGAGLPEYGVDYDSRDNPHQASLEKRAVSFTKGCYLGQEVVCMQDMRGKVKRRVVCLSVEPGAAPAAGMPVQGPDGQGVGKVTSFAPSLGLAMARVDGPFFEPGTVLRLAERPATVVERPVEVEPK